MRFVSPVVAMSPAWRRRRFRFERLLGQDVALERLVAADLPVPVTLKRFSAPLWVFIFGIGTLSSYFGARIIVMDFPSTRPALSILPSPPAPAHTRSSTA